MFQHPTSTIVIIGSLGLRHEFYTNGYKVNIKIVDSGIVKDGSTEQNKENTEEDGTMEEVNADNA